MDFYNGKVRNVHDLGNNYLLMEATDKVSSFDRHIGVIPGKGRLLNLMSARMFELTRHIIKNHMVSYNENVMLVEKCTPFKIEVVIRAYMTGSTSTSLWTHYKNGGRNYCGIELAEGYLKNQKLTETIITPTTKGETDVPISRENIVSEGYMTQEEVDFVFSKAMELFRYGEKIATQMGMILVDTKFEFGRNKNNEIILIDEVMTCDSSRYWGLNSYMDRFLNNVEPEKIDKDCVRDWVRENVQDPYKDTIPDIPDNIIRKVQNAYTRFYEGLMNVQPTRSNIVVIFSGSPKDESHVNKLISNCESQGLQCVSYVASAHKKPRKVLELIETYDTNLNYNNVVYVTVAGRSNALSGVVASNSTRPVIACPPFADKDDMMVNINSTLQCPSYVPVMTILEPINVALSIKRIFGA